MTRSFLVINPFGIGDVLFSTPLVRQLHEAHPGARIYYLCNRRTSTFLKNHPLITKLFIYERDEFRAAEKRSFWEGSKMLISFLNSIRKEHIEVAIDLSLNSKFGLYAILAGIPVRAGFDHKKRGRFLNRKLPLEGFDSKHAAEYYLDVLSLIGITPRITPMEIYDDAESKAWADQAVTPNELLKNPVILSGAQQCEGSPREILRPRGAQNDANAVFQQPARKRLFAVTETWSEL